MSRVSTGIDALDRHLDGGLREGTVTCLVSSPASQCNPLFYQFMEDREWLYVTTYRSERAVEHELDELLWGDVVVEHVGVERPIRGLHGALEDLDEERNVIVDTMNAFEETDRQSQYTALLNGIKDYLLDTDRVALLHCTELDTPPALREVTLTIADVVWELELVTDERSVEARLVVPKYRSRAAIDEVIKLELGREVSVDTSKNIA